MARRLLCGCSALLILASASSGAAQTEPRNVLLLNSFEREFSPQNVFGATLRTELARQFSAPINFFEVSLHPTPAIANPREGPIVDYLLATFADRRLDLVVSMGGPAAAFVQKYQQQLFPATPLILASVDARFVQSASLAPNITAVAVANDPRRIVETALHLLPQTKHLYVVLGSSPWEQVWRQEMERALDTLKDGRTIAWLDDLSFSELLQRSATLPANSVIFYVLLTLDAKGMPQVEERALTELHAVANAPMFGLHSTQLGLGVVGGPVMSVDEIGRTTARVALRILQGESPDYIKPIIQSPGTPTFDWRELRRWKISDGRLPPGSVVLFREPTAWERYKWAIVGTVSFGLLEGVLVVGLLVVQVRRRRAERSLRESEERFRLLANTAPVMIWMSDHTKRCTDFNRQWLEFTGRSLEAELGEGWVEGVHPDDRKDCLETYSQAFDRQEPFAMEYRLRRHDGEFRWVLDTGVPRFTPDGSLVGYIGSAMDVTQHRLAEAALSNLSQKLIEAHEQERAWIARELHDDVCQRMAGLTMQLHSVSRQPSGDHADGGDWRLSVASLCREFVALGKDVQTLSHRLHSSKLDYLGLAAAATAFCRELSAQRDVTIDFVHHHVPPDLSKDVALGLFRVLQEALNNAIRHSGERHFDVTLRGGHDDIQLEIEDYGVGFDSDAALRSHGLGLISMRERLTLINGELSIDSQPGIGTTIRARVPLGRRRGRSLETDVAGRVDEGAGGLDAGAPGTWRSPVSRS